MNAWRSYTDRKAAVRMKLAKVVRRAQNMRVSCALLGWQTVARRRAHVRRLAERSLVRLQMMVVAKSFEAMLALTRKMKRVRGMMAAGLNRLMMAVFAEWADAIGYEVVERRRADELAVLKEDLDRAHEQHDLHGSEMARRVLASAGQKMRMRGATKVMNAWRSYTDRKAAVRVIVRRVLLRLSHLCSASVFGAWTVLTSEHRSLRKLLQCGIGRMHHMMVSNALFGWQHYTKRKIALSMRLRMSIKRLQRLPLYFAFSGWQSITAHADRIRLISDKAVRRAQHSLAASALEGWRSTAVELILVRNNVKLVKRRVQDMAYDIALSSPAMATGALLPPDDPATVQRVQEVTNTVGAAAVSAAVMVAAEFIALRKANLSRAESVIHQLEIAVQQARQAFVVVAAHCSTIPASNTEAGGPSTTRQRASRMAEAVLQHLDDSETVTLAIRYNTLCGPYDEVGMHEELLAIGTPGAMARDVSALLARKGESEIKGSLFSARTIVAQLQVLPSIIIDIVPTQQQKLAVQQAGLDISGSASDGRPQVRMERELSKVGFQNDSLVSNALWDCVSILTGHEFAF